MNTDKKLRRSAEAPLRPKPLMTRVELAEAITKVAQDEPFTMPFFLGQCLLNEMRRQGIRYVTMNNRPDETLKARIES